MDPLPNTANPTTTPNDRDENGHFRKGNKGGPGNPFARRTARIRQALIEAVTDEDIQAATNALKQKAREGDVAAIKLLFAYTIGKPTDAPNPDTLDRQELETFLTNHIDSPMSVLGLLQGTPLQLLLTILRTALPFLLDSKSKTAKEILCNPAPQEEEMPIAPEDEMTEAEAEEVARAIDKAAIPDNLQELLQPKKKRERKEVAAPKPDASQIETLKEQIQALAHLMMKKHSANPAPELEVPACLSERMGWQAGEVPSANGGNGAKPPGKGGKGPSANGSNGKLPHPE